MDFKELSYKEKELEAIEDFLERASMGDEVKARLKGLIDKFREIAMRCWMREEISVSDCEELLKTELEIHNIFNEVSSIAV